VSEGLAAAASALSAQQTRLEALANDVANANTPGYAKERLAFRDLTYSAGTGAGTAALDAGPSFQQGPVESSDNPLALAIQGPGFFQVRLGDGRLALTRGGDFRLDANRSVVLADGARLEPPITGPAGVDPGDVKISSDGTVSAAGKQLGKIVLADVPARASLMRLGDGLYLPTTASGRPVAAAASTTLQQGALEGSNVDPGDTMLEMLDAQRSYELASRAVKMQDDLMQIANEIRR
jgi:flagellar basal-body rod protein FlgG